MQYIFAFLKKNFNTLQDLMVCIPARLLDRVNLEMLESSTNWKFQELLLTKIALSFPNFTKYTFWKSVIRASTSLTDVFFTADASASLLIEIINSSSSNLRSVSSSYTLVAKSEINLEVLEHCRSLERFILHRWIVLSLQCHTIFNI